MVIAHHLMWTLYGWWLPNDPRGSTSRTIHSDLIAQLGELHFGRRKIQPASREIRAFYDQAAAALKHDLLSFHPHEFPLVSAILGDTIRHLGYTCYAAAVMPDHVHLCLRKHRDLAEDMIEKIQTESRLRFSACGLRPDDHPTWTEGGWKVFLDSPEDVWRTLRYIENNPIPLRLPVQHWPCVTPYDNWPHHNPRT